MSSDVMVVCKEFKNQYKYLTKENNYQAEIPAIFIDEASMGEPWNEFGKWFVERFFNGNSLMDAIIAGQMGGQKEVDEIQSEIHDSKFTKVDYESVKLALEKMQTHQNLNKDNLLEYLKKCIGNSISTENW